MRPAPPLVALAAQTRLPVPGTATADPADHARAVPWYPGAGLAIGALLAVTGAVFQGLPPFLAATLVVAAWVGVTGARSLQGLADTIDGYLGGGGERRRILAIMRDRRGGVGAVAAVVLAVLAKAVAAGCLVQQGQWAALVAAPVAGRTLTTGLLATTAHTRDMPAAADHLLRLDRAAVLVGSLVGAALLTLLAGTQGLALAAVLLALGALLRALYKRSLGGVTGDALGAACEAGELAALGVAVWGFGGCL
jgi:adenosylcobinamide-GDP ribazoletransferase